VSGPGRFDPSELRIAGEPEPPIAASADALAVARELDAVAAAVDVRPSEGFESRVLAAIANEPAPRLVVRPGAAVRGGRPAAFLLAVREAWGVATSGGRPMAVRAQALAFVLLIAVAGVTLSGLTAVAVGGLLGTSSSPAPSIDRGPSIPPASAEPTGPAPTPEPTPAPPATESARPAATPAAGETAKPAATAKPAQTPHPTRTARPIATTTDGETPEPGDTAEPSHDAGRGGSGSSDDGGTDSGGPGPG
jgi:hypothetical protein